MAAVSLRSDYSRHVCAPYLGVMCYPENSKMKLKKSSVIVLSVLTIINLFIICNSVLNGYVKHRGSIWTMTDEAPMFWFDIFFRVSVNIIFWIVLFKYGDDEY